MFVFDRSFYFAVIYKRMEVSPDKYALQKVMIRRSVPLAEAEKHYKSITKRKPRKERATDDWWHFRYLPPTKFVSRSFRTKVVNDDIHLVFGKLKEEHARLEGRGLFDYFKKGYDYVKNKAVDAFNYIKNAVSITDYSATTKPLLEKYGILPIVGITIRREPVNIAVELALQGVSEGKWLDLKKKYGFDEFFHLSMVVTVAGAVERVWKNGVKKMYPKELAIEKLSVVSINEDVEIKPTMETLEVRVTHRFSIKDMFDKAREKYGDTRFFSYSALGNNNCQNFIQMLLTVEGLYTEEVNNFVFQDITALVKELPESTQLFSQGVTHLGALANKYLGIGGAKKPTNEIIIPKEEFVKEHKHLVGLLSKSEDPALQKEAKDQAKELKMKGGKKPCWKGYEMVGMKKKDGKTVPNCVGGKKVCLDDLRGEGISSSKLTTDERREKAVSHMLDLNLARWNQASLAGQPNPDLRHYEAERIYGDLNLPVGDPNRFDMTEDERQRRIKAGWIEDDKKQKGKGGNKSSGFIRAMMARDRASMDEKAKFKEINKKKFASLDRDGFDVKEMTKATHNLTDTKTTLTKNDAIKSFYAFVKANAPQHQPTHAHGTNYVGTYDLDGMYDKWVAQQKQQFEEAKQETDTAVDIPSSFFDLPEPKKVVSRNESEVVVVPVDKVPAVEKKEEKKDEEDRQVVLGRFESPKDVFEREINKMVDYAVKYFRFNDMISYVLQPKHNPHKHGSTWSISDICSMYYYITRYKLPILKLGETEKVRVQKDVNAVLRHSFHSYAERDEYYKEHYNEKHIWLFNDLGRVVEYATSTKAGKESIQHRAEMIKLHLDKGEPQIILYFGIGDKTHGHQNLLLIRAVDKKIYIIDPHGSQTTSVLEPSYKKQKAVIEMIAKLIGDYTVVPSADSCPYIHKEVRRGFQAIESIAGHKMGMCGWWSNFIIEMCCLKPDVPFEALYKEASMLLSDEPEKLFKVVMKYQYTLQQIIIQIAKNAGIDVKDDTDIRNVYMSLSVVLSDRLLDLLGKRREILGYAKL